MRYTNKYDDGDVDGPHWTFNLAQQFAVRKLLTSSSAFVDIVESGIVCQRINKSEVVPCGLFAGGFIVPFQDVKYG